MRQFKNKRVSIVPPIVIHMDTVLIRSQIRRWESLPCLTLVPSSCLLYVCTSCSFVNLHGRMCPWCFALCTVDPAEEQEPPSRPRRRVTSPSLLNDLQKAQLKRLERCTFPDSKNLMSSSSPMSKVIASREHPSVGSRLPISTDAEIEHKPQRSSSRRAMYSSGYIVNEAKVRVRAQNALPKS